MLKVYYCIIFFLEVLNLLLIWCLQNWFLIAEDCIVFTRLNFCIIFRVEIGPEITLCRDILFGIDLSIKNFSFVVKNLRMFLFLYSTCLFWYLPCKWNLFRFWVFFRKLINVFPCLFFYKTYFCMVEALFSILFINTALFGLYICFYLLIILLFRERFLMDEILFVLWELSQVWIFTLLFLFL